MIKHRLATILTVATMVLGATASAALASDQSTKQDAGWGCADAVGLPDGHCISPGTRKNFANIVERELTFQLLVFDSNGDFVTSESATFNASADSRPCPHDTDARNTDGTYWEFGTGSGLYVCHHRSH